MQVFCYEMPDNQIPQIIALKPDTNLMEFQSFMYDPPAEYQDLLTFEPPPDYRDFIANSLNVFRNEVTFDFIDDDDDDSENDSKENIRNSEISSRNKLNHHLFDQNQNSKWQSMILNNNLDSLEEEQIIGVLKEDDILQAIGSQVTLPESNNGGGSRSTNNNGDENEFDNYEENLSSADFPVHHLNSYFLDSSGNINEDEDEVCCVDSSPNGSLQDLASDSSITSQDTIILINQNKTFHIETVNQTPSNENSMTNNENLYENLQPCHREINVIKQMVNGIANSVTVNMQVNAPTMTAGNKFISLNNDGGPILQQQHSVLSSNKLMPLPCYAILETNRTSSSSSLSSASSSTSSLVPQTVSCPAAQQNSQTLPLLISTSTNIQQIKSQTSPNSNSPVSSSSSSSTSNLMNHEQFGTVSKNSNSPTTIQQIHISIPDNNKNSNSANFSPNESNSNMNATYLNLPGHHVDHANNVSPRMATGQQHICIVNNPGTTTLRPGQVIYRYPYALIQPGMNGMSTIRPVQYI
ncbi:hypothetical protein BLA29_002389, partial [Euroglyphus maynei]